MSIVIGEKEGAVHALNAAGWRLRRKLRFYDRLIERWERIVATSKYEGPRAEQDRAYDEGALRDLRTRRNEAANIARGLFAYASRIDRGTV